MFNFNHSSSEPMLLKIVRLLRWNKPSGRLLIILPGWWSAVLAAQGRPPLSLIVIIFLGGLSAIAAGSIINDLWDKDVDSQVARTKDRPLASGALSIKVGLVAAVVASLCAWASASYLNPLSFWLCVAAVPVIGLYPLAKRFFPIPQLVLSLCWGFSTLVSWSAVTGTLEPETWLLWAATAFFSFGFDTVYAIADREDDARLGIYSSPLFFGDRAPEVVGLASVGTISLFAVLGWIYNLKLGFWLALVLASVIWFYQYQRIRQPNQDSQVYVQAFGENVGVGFLLLGGLLIGLLSPL